MTRDRVSMIVGALVVFALQIMLAPNIAIFSVVPDFLAAYALVVAIARPQNSAVVLGFVLGMTYDILGYGPMGSMALLLVLATFCITQVFAVLDNDSPAVALVLLLVLLLAIELAYALILLLFGMVDSLGSAIIYRALPGALYNCVLALIFYPLTQRFVVPSSSARKDFPHGGTTLRSTEAPMAGPVLQPRVTVMKKKKRF